MKTSRLEIFIHTAIIIGSLVFINIPSLNLRIGVFSTGDGSFLWPSIIGTLINCILFYGNAGFLIPKFLRLQKKGLYVLLFISLSLFLTVVEGFIDYGFIPKNTASTVNNDTWFEIYLLITITHLLTILASFAYRFSKDWFYHQQLQSKLNEEKLSAELAFLKSQVNPHFLFNTLNNLFSMAIQNKDEATADGILKLANLMRYMLHESNNDYIELSKELDYIYNYIELQRIRLLNQPVDNIQITIEGNAEHIRVAPMLFIPFIENAFKHGVSMNQPSVIKIHFIVSKNEIRLTVNNMINRLKKYEPHEISGVGLENVKRRLELLYPLHYQLVINDHNDRYNVDLTIRLSNKA